MERRSLEISTLGNGMVSGRFVMTGLAGETLKTAIGSLLPPPAVGDIRTATQRRHDALEDLAVGFLETTNTTTTGGEKPHLNIHADLDALKAEPGGLHETTSSPPGRAPERGEYSDRKVGGRGATIPTTTIDAPEPLLEGSFPRRRRVCSHDESVLPPTSRPPAGRDLPPVRLRLREDSFTLAQEPTSAQAGGQLRGLLCRYHHTLTHPQDAMKRLEPAFQGQPATTGRTKP